MSRLLSVRWGFACFFVSSLARYTLKSEGLKGKQLIPVPLTPQLAETGASPSHGKMLVRTLLLGALLVVSLLSCVDAQASRPNGEGIDNLKPLRPNDDGGPANEKCEKIRTLDGRCSNTRRKEWGSARQPVFSYIRGRSAKKPTGQNEKSAREISNILSKQVGDMFNRRGLSEMVTFFGQFLDHNIVSSVADKSSPFDIPIPEDDPIMRNFSAGVLPFERSIRGPVREGKRAERAINSLSSVVDLVAVYGTERERNKVIRAGKKKNGFLVIGSKNNLPFNEANQFNAPSKAEAFLLAGDHRANEHPILTSLHTVFLREHNLLAREISTTFPDWSGEEIYQAAREVNIAQFQRMVFDEFYVMMTGRQLDRYTGHKKNVNPGVSDTFSTAAFRIGHTMVGNVINRRGKKNRKMPSLELKDVFFRPEIVMREGVDDFIRGAVFNRAQEVDLSVVDGLRNFLFTKIREESGFDLIATNIQRGRDHAIPTYNDIRKTFGLPLARQFSDINSNPNVQSKLMNAYATVDNVEAWPGLMAEKHVSGASMGETMLRVWEAEFTRLRDGDRFFYLLPIAIRPEILDKIPRIKTVLQSKEVFKTVLLRTTKISPSELQGSVWKSSV